MSDLEKLSASISEIELRTMVLRQEMAQNERKIAQSIAHERKAMRAHVAKTAEELAKIIGEETGLSDRKMQEEIAALKVEVSELRGVIAELRTIRPSASSPGMMTPQPFPRFPAAGGRRRRRTPRRRRLHIVPKSNRLVSFGRGRKVSAPESFSNSKASHARAVWDGCSGVGR